MSNNADACCLLDDACSSSSSKDIYLSSEERFEVWLVKAAERPELLVSSSTDCCWHQDEHKGCDNNNDNAPDDEDGDDASNTTKELVLPLTDGCDLEEWRRQKLVFTNEKVLESVLNVGQGCVLLRRERQIPLLSSRALHKWNELRERLLQINLLQEAPRIQYTSDMSLYQEFERDNTVAILHGCADMWPALQSCRFDRLVERFGHLPWRFSDTHGETLTLRSYQKYLNSLEGQLDDAPLAVYDSQFALDERRQILDEYSVPSCFDTDLFDLLDDGKEEEDNQQQYHRPPYRWILIGPARSGTGLHVDPVGTHAWVTLIQGLKRWILFPPDTCRESIGMTQHHPIPSSIWFRDHYDAVTSRHDANNNNKAIHVLQRPGETVYVPAGWLHLVLNLELSVAITHNYATPYPCPKRLWQAVRDEEPDMALQWAAKLQQHRPELYASMMTECLESSSSTETNEDDTDDDC